MSYPENLIELSEWMAIQSGCCEPEYHPERTEALMTEREARDPAYKARMDRRRAKAAAAKARADVRRVRRGTL